MVILLQKDDNKNCIEDALIYNPSSDSVFYISTDNNLLGGRKMNIKVSSNNNGKYFIDNIPTEIDFADLNRKDFIAKYKKF